VRWLTDWNDTQGFWTAVQGVGTVLAAVAALIALGIAKSQLGQLIESNRLLAKSNDAMTDSNLSLTRPYVVVDFELMPTVGRSGNTTSSLVNVLIENVGRTPAKNLTMKVDRPFAPHMEPDQPGWKGAIKELNRVMDGETVVKSLTHVKPLRYYLDDAGDIMGGDDPSEWQSWVVTAKYYDADGNEFKEEWTLELGYWRQSLAIPDPLVRIGKVIEGVAYEVKNKRLPSLDFTFPEPRADPKPTRKMGRPSHGRSRQLAARSSKGLRR
jgi:hypothetical protein